MASFLLSAASTLLVPWANLNESLGSRPLAYVLAIMFWLGLLAGIVFEILASKARKGLKDVSVNGKPGIISFFKTKEGIAADIIFVIALVCAILLRNVSVVSAIFLFLTLAALYFSCIFNGRNYRTFKELNKKEEGEKNEK